MLKGKRKTAAWIKEVIGREKFRSGDISVVFCSPERHIEINRTFLGHDYHTDVITFDYSDKEAGVVSGDIMIDPVTVADNAATFGTSPENEMLRIIIHGILHLCGYGDKNPEQQKVMRAKEDDCLTLFLRK